MRDTMRVNHACCSVEREIIMRVPLNSHGFAKPRMIPTWAGLMLVPHILSLVGVKSRLVADHRLLDQIVGK